MLEMNEKISEMHKAMFQRMLGIKGDLPDFLLKKYFSMKKLIDKVDGPLSPFDLASMAVSCGFDTETMAFVKMDFSLEEIKEFGREDMPKEKVSPVPLPERRLKNGTRVEFSVDDDKLQGTIKSAKAFGDTITYTVTTEDNLIHDVTEDEIDLVE